MGASNPLALFLITVASLTVSSVCPHQASAQDAGEKNPAQEFTKDKEPEPVAAQSQPDSKRSSEGAKSASKKQAIPGAADVNPQRRDLSADIELFAQIRGYCPVSYFAKGEARVGSPKFSAMHRGKLYYLVDASSQKKFVENPDQYVPQFGGLCTTALGGSYNNRLPSDSTVFEIREGKLYLFSSDRARRAYATKPDWFLGRAEAGYVEPEIKGYCPVSFQQRIKALHGRNEYTYTYDDKIYYFANRSARREFIRNPNRYSPAYDGYCADNVIKGRRYPVDPQYFFVSGDRTFLFSDETAKLRFTMNPTVKINKADAQWAKDQTARKKRIKVSTPKGE